MTHMMADTETLGRKPGCVIMSIGAVIFDPFDRNAPQDKFYRTIDVASQLMLGFHIEPETLEWWRKQDKEAQAALSKNTVTIKEAMGDFQLWCRNHNVDRIWAHGAPFDPPIIEEAFRLCDLMLPWRYSQVRDTRTVFDLFDVDLTKFARVGTYHNAIDDAQFQVNCIQDAIQRGRGTEWLSKISDTKK